MIRDFFNREYEVDVKTLIAAAVVISAILICSLVTYGDNGRQREDIKILSNGLAGIQKESFTAYKNSDKTLYLYGKDKTEIYTMDEKVYPKRLVLNGESIHTYMINLHGAIHEEDELKIINESGWKEPLVIINYVDVNQIRFYQISTD